MTRCTTSLSAQSGRRAFHAALLAASMSCLPALAQSLPADLPRNFPPTAQFGELAITQFPEVTINGQPIRTSPGFRLFNQQQALVFANQYAGQKLLVSFVIEPQTQWLHTAWILTPAEMEKHREALPRSIWQRLFSR